MVRVLSARRCVKHRNFSGNAGTLTPPKNAIHRSPIVNRQSVPFRLNGSLVLQILTALAENSIHADGNGKASTMPQEKPLKASPRRNIDIADLNTHNLRRGDEYG